MSSEDQTNSSNTIAEQEPTIVSVQSEPLTLEKKAYLFNQFYFDLLKKLKINAKQNKEKSKEARNVLRAIKNSYSSYETGSVEYIQKFKDAVTAEFWKQYYECPVETVDKFLLTEPAFDAYVYHQISVDMIAVCLQDTFVLHHYLTIFAIMMEDLTNDDMTKAMNILKNMKNKDITAEFETVTNEEARKWIHRLYTIYTAQLSNVFGQQFSDIESTSLGKLAKEIMEEVDLSNIQNSLSNDGDIFKSLTDPNSGIASLLGTVSQKMISKLASGEIKQENLLQDAMKFATKLPGLMPGGGGAAPGMDFGKMASMMQNMMGMLGGGNDDDDASGSGGMDMGSLMNMMQGMMGGNGGKAKRSMANDPRAAGVHSAAKALSGNVRKSAQIKKLREKIKQRATKENIPDQVE